MSEKAIIVELFMAAGYVLTALALTLWYFLGKRPAYVLRLGSISNAMLAFYALCMGLISVAALVIAVTAHRQPETDSLWRFAGMVLLPLALIVTLFLAAKRRPFALFIPFGILIITASGNRGFMEALLAHEPYIYLLMGALYFLVLFLLYLASIWIERAAK